MEESQIKSIWKGCYDHLANFEVKVITAIIIEQYFEVKVITAIIIEQYFEVNVITAIIIEQYFEVKVITAIVIEYYLKSRSSLQLSLNNIVKSTPIEIE
jgi:hypothetical protein